MTEKVMTVAYRVVHGKAKNYRYWGAKYYRSRRQKKRDGEWTWRPIREYGPDRRSYQLAIKDAKEVAKKKKIGFTDGIVLGVKVY